MTTLAATNAAGTGRRRNSSGGSDTNAFTSVRARLRSCSGCFYFVPFRPGKHRDHRLRLATLS